MNDGFKIVSESITLKEDMFNKRVVWNAIGIGVFTTPIGAVAYGKMRSRVKVIDGFIARNKARMIKISEHSNDLTLADKRKIALCKLNLDYAPRARQIHVKMIGADIDDKAKYNRILDKMEAEYKKRYNIIKKEINYEHVQVDENIDILREDQFERRVRRKAIVMGATIFLLPVALSYAILRRRELVVNKFINKNKQIIETNTGLVNELARKNKRNISIERDIALSKLNIKYGLAVRKLYAKIDVPKSVDVNTKETIKRQLNQMEKDYHRDYKAVKVQYKNIKRDYRRSK